MTLKTKILNFFRALFKNKVGENILRFFIKHGMFSKLAPNQYQYPANSFRKFTTNGIQMNVDISDYIGHYIYFGFKDLSVAGLLGLVRPNMTILDVGANIGFTALNMANKSQPNGVVYAFEPDPFNFSQLRSNTSQNKQNVLIQNIGLGSKKDQLKLAVNTFNNRGGNRINNDATENYSLIDIIKIDDFVSSNKIEKVDLVKIDVEGFEMHVLNGAHEMLKKDKPVLFIELSDDNLKEQGSTAKQLIQHLTNIGYSCYNSVDNAKVTLSDDFTNCHYDIICKVK